MFMLGASNEVRKFLEKKINNERSAHKIIGVKEISDYINNKISLDEAKKLIKIRTRQYAKRQFTWSRGNMRSWEMIDNSNYGEILKKIRK